MKFIIKASGRQITLPITPESFEVTTARHTQMVNIHEVGDVNLPGNAALGAIKLHCIFPKQSYPFAEDYGSPYDYVGQIQSIISRKKPVRFIVTGTEVNERVLIESISYGEKDGTGDVYASISMAGYRGVSAVQTAQVLVESTVKPVLHPVLSRPAEKEQPREQLYKVQANDTWAFIALNYYDDAGLANKLCEYNGSRSPGLAMHSGDVIKIPIKEALVKG